MEKGCAGVLVERSRSAEEPLGSRILGCDWLRAWQKERANVTCIPDAWNVERAVQRPSHSTTAYLRDVRSSASEVEKPFLASSQAGTCQYRGTSAAIERLKINRRLFVHIDQGDIKHMSTQRDVAEPKKPDIRHVQTLKGPSRLADNRESG
jgi:hypothetical protein